MYAKEIITTTLYKFIHLYFVHQETDTCNPNIIQVVCESKENNIINAEVPRQFCNELIDQQIRYNTNIQFGHIRDLIVEEAFRPISEKFFEEVYRDLYEANKGKLSSDSRRNGGEGRIKQLRIIDSTTISLFSNAIFKGVGRHPKTGKKKGGIKVHFFRTADIWTVNKIA